MGDEVFTSIDGFTKPIKMQREGEETEMLSWRWWHMKIGMFYHEWCVGRFGMVWLSFDVFCSFCLCVCVFFCVCVKKWKDDAFRRQITNVTLEWFLFEFLLHDCSWTFWIMLHHSSQWDFCKFPAFLGSRTSWPMSWQLRGMAPIGHLWSHWCRYSLGINFKLCVLICTDMLLLVVVIIYFFYVFWLYCVRMFFLL